MILAPVQQKTGVEPDTEVEAKAEAERRINDQWSWLVGCRLDNSLQNQLLLPSDVFSTAIPKRFCIHYFYALLLVLGQ